MDEGRLGPYSNAQNYGGKKITLEIAPVEMPPGMKVQGAESATRTKVLEDANKGLSEAEQANTLPWDNTEGWLGRKGPGTPGVTSREMRQTGKYWDPNTGALIDPAKGGLPLPKGITNVSELRAQVAASGGNLPALAASWNVPEAELRALLEELRIPFTP